MSQFTDPAALLRHPHHRPLIIGLTGSIGMGKSAVANMLRDLGVPVFDADAEVHRLQGPDGALLPAIEAAFPGTTSAPGLDRKKLGEQVFGDSEALRRLEAIVHPAVAAARERFARKHRAYPFLVYDIPLLFEKTGHAKVDLIMVVSASAWQQRQRVMARPDMSHARFARIKSLQMPDHIKRRRADYIINTGQLLWQTRADVCLLVKKLHAALA